MSAKKAGAEKAVTRKSPKELPVFTENAGLFKIAGIGKSKQPGGFSWRKHEIPL
ncbi:MAG: hypothetical protein Q7O66_03015 [Dehalococcoidia bacterium]|nr:hypothetical protein [Dehalococcoidia bacterium]